MFFNRCFSFSKKMKKLEMKKEHIIKDVEAESIAFELGLEKDDVLLSVNNSVIRDVFDYKIQISEESVLLNIRKKSGEEISFDVEKDEDEDLGLVFENYLMDKEHACRNKCIFCFVDRLPCGMRKSLYFKDDDPRLSFLAGNYVTLTNIDDKELERLISLRLSPMNISVHSTENKVRQRMLGNKNAGDIMRQMRIIAEEGIDINSQIVICPGINDNKSLKKTLDDLAGLGERLRSIAVVPVGLAKLREGVFDEQVVPVGKHDAEVVINTVKHYQKKFLVQRNERVVYAADEMYIKAGIPFPPPEEYEDYPQLENGVGIAPLFMETMEKGIKSRKSDGKITVSKKTKGKAVMITGTDAGPFIKKFEKDLESLYGVKFLTKQVKNTFFGENVTVAGLLTGRDIFESISRDEDFNEQDIAFVPDCMLKADRKVFLDDMGLDELSRKSGWGIIDVPSSGDGFLAFLDDFFSEGEIRGYWR